MCVNGIGALNIEAAGKKSHYLKFTGLSLGKKTVFKMLLNTLWLP